MEGLYDLASHHELQRISRRRKISFDLIHIAVNQETHETEYESISVDEDSLLTKLKQASQTTSDSNVNDRLLQLVYVHRGEDALPQMSGSVYQELLAQLGVDPGILYFVSCNTYGLSHIKPVQSHLHSFQLGTRRYTLIWTFDPRRRITRGVFLGRSPREFLRMRELIRRYKEHIDSPCLFVLLVSIILIKKCDENAQKYARDARRIELKSGHGGWARKRMVEDESLNVPSISALLELSQGVSRILSNVLIDSQHFDIASSLLDYLSTDPTWRDQLPDACRAKHDADRMFFQMESVVLQNHIRNAKPSLSSLHQRLENQSNVVSCPSCFTSPLSLMISSSSLSLLIRMQAQA